MSVYLAGGGNSVGEVMAGHEEYLLASFSAGIARQHGQKLQRRPLEGFPSHAEVVGRKSKAVSSAFAKSSNWVIGPPADFHL